MIKRLVMSVLDRIFNVLDTLEWLLDEEKHPTLAAVEDACFAFLNELEIALTEKGLLK